MTDSPNLMFALDRCGGQVGRRSLFSIIGERFGEMLLDHMCGGNDCRPELLGRGIGLRFPALQTRLVCAIYGGVGGVKPGRELLAAWPAEAVSNASSWLSHLGTYCALELTVLTLHLWTPDEISNL